MADRCALVTLLPHVLYWTDDEVSLRLNHHQKREPLTTVTVTNLSGLGAKGTALEATSLVLQDKELKELRIQIGFSLDKVEVSLKYLQKTLDSLARVALQNRFRLD